MAKPVSPYVYPGVPDNGLYSMYDPVHRICLELGLNTNDIKSPSRKIDVVKWRSAMCVALHIFGWKVVELGRFTNRDHSSITHYNRKHNANLKHWIGYKTCFQECIRVITELGLTEPIKEEST